MQRKKEILNEIYDRCGAKTQKRLEKTNANEKLVNKELSQIKNLMEMNSSRINPNLSEFADSME